MLRLIQKRRIHRLLVFDAHPSVVQTQGEEDGAVAVFGVDADGSSIGGMEENAVDASGFRIPVGILPVGTYLETTEPACADGEQSSAVPRTAYRYQDADKNRKDDEGQNDDNRVGGSPWK